LLEPATLAAALDAGRRLPIEDAAALVQQPVATAY
jgi:hypothetical protein